MWSWTTNPQWLICISGVAFRIDTNGGNHVFVQVKVDNSLLKGDVRALFTTNVTRGWSTKSQFGFTLSSCLFYSQIFCSDVMKASFYPIHALFLFIWRQALPVSHDPGIVYYIWQPHASMLLLSRRKEKPCVYTGDGGSRDKCSEMESGSNLHKLHSSLRARASGAGLLSTLCACLPTPLPGQWERNPLRLWA